MALDLDHLLAIFVKIIFRSNHAESIKEVGLMVTNVYRNYQK